MRVQPRDEALAESADDAGGLGSLLMILEALLGCEAGHADVVGGLAVASGIAEVDDVNMMMSAGHDRARRRPIAGPNKVRPTAGMLVSSDARFVRSLRCHRHARVLCARRSLAGVRARVRGRVRRVVGLRLPTRRM